MKKTFIILLLSFYASVVLAEQETSVSVSIPELVDSACTATLRIVDKANISSKDVEKSQLFSNGRFKFDFKLTKPVYITIRLNGQFLFTVPLHLLIEPGDHISIEVPDLNKRRTIDLMFSGKGSEKAELIKLLKIPVISKIEHQPPTIQQSIENFIVNRFTCISIADSVWRKHHQLVDPQIARIIRANQYEDSLEPVVLRLTRQDPAAKKEVFSDFMSRLINSGFMDKIFDHDERGDVYLTQRPMTFELVKIAFMMQHSRQINIFAEPLAFYKTILDTYNKYPATREYVCANFLHVYLAKKGWTKEAAILTDEFFKNALPNDKYNAQLLTKIAAVQKLVKGTPFYNFSLPNDTGKTVELSDFRGKTVVIDFYFTGCGGCRLLAPVLEEIEKSYPGKDVVFLSISIDDDKQEWERGRGVYSSKSSVQLYTDGKGSDHPLIKFVGIRAYPSLFIVDKYGNFYDRGIDPRGNKNEFMESIDQCIKL